MLDVRPATVSTFHERQRRQGRARPRPHVLGRPGSIALAEDWPRDQAAVPASRPIRVTIPPASLPLCLRQTTPHPRLLTVDPTRSWSHAIRSDLNDRPAGYITQRGSHCFGVNRICRPQLLRWRFPCRTRRPLARAEQPSCPCWLSAAAMPRRSVCDGVAGDTLEATRLKAGPPLRCGPWRDAKRRLGCLRRLARHDTAHAGGG
jgi:hypothetical protein